MSAILEEPDESVIDKNQLEGLIAGLRRQIAESAWKVDHSVGEWKDLYALDVAIAQIRVDAYVAIGKLIAEKQALTEKVRAQAFAALPTEKS